MTPSTSCSTSDDSPVLIVASVQNELSPIVHRWRLTCDAPWFTGRIGSHRVVAGFTGMGARRATEVLQAMLQEHHPSQVIHLGFAGGLDPSLKAGAILKIDRVLDGSGMMARLDDRQVPLLAADDGRRSSHQTLLTIDHLAHSPTEKAELFAKHQASAIDMETFHVARTAAGRQLRLTMLRAISDPATMAILPEATGWVNPDGTDRIAKAIGHLLVHPWKIAATWRLGRNAGLGSRQLADAVAKILESN